MVDTIRQVGRRHCDPKGVSFGAENWLLWKNSVMAVIEPYQIRQYTQVAWNSLLSFVISEMKQSFHEEIRSKYSQTLDQSTLSTGIFDNREEEME